MPKMPRYYVGQSGKLWLVLDRRKTKMHNDVVETCRTRDLARARAQELNKEDRQERNIDTQIGARETI